MNYKSAGVDLEVAESATNKIIDLARKTQTPNVLHGPGLFGGFWDFSQHGCRHPVLVSSIDGVGTKVKLAAQLNRFQNIGIDLVNHCVNDIAVGGAEPLFFLDYLACGKLREESLTELIAGVADACAQAGCALIGGETAEMPGVYAGKNFDIAGAIVGVVDKEHIIDGGRVEPGDLLIGVASTGLHTNGYSLARRIVASHDDCSLDRYVEDLGDTIGNALLRPHRSYLELIRKLRDEPGIHGFAHVTGGGIVGNTKRLLRAGLTLSVDWDSWDWPPIFKLLQKCGQVPTEEMRSVFNLGVGLVIIISPESIERVDGLLSELNEVRFTIGTVTAAEDR